MSGGREGRFAAKQFGKRASALAVVLLLASPLVPAAAPQARAYPLQAGFGAAAGSDSESVPASTPAATPAPAPARAPAPAPVPELAVDPGLPDAEEAGLSQNRVTLLVSTSRVLSVHGVERVAVADPAVADVTVVSKGEILIIGESPGRTSLHIWYEDGYRRTFQVEVFLESAELLDQFRGRLGIPTVDVWMVNGAMVLEGSVDGESEHERALKLAELYADRVVDLLSTSAWAGDHGILERRIEAAIGHPDVRVSVYNGMVLLEGAVEGALVKERAESIAGAFSERVHSLLRTASAPLDGVGRNAATGVAGPSGPSQHLPGEQAPPGRAVEERLRTLKGLLDNPDIVLQMVRGSLVVQGVVPSESEAERVEALAGLLFPRAIVVLTVNEYIDSPIARLVEATIDIDGIQVREGIEGRLILDGEVATQRDRDRAVKIAAAYSSSVTDLLELRDPLQVLLQVQVVEVKRTAARELGAQWGSLQRGVFDSYVIPFSEGFGPIPPFDLGKSAPIAMRLKMLAERGDATLLAAPSLVTLSGKEADFLAGGEVPVGIPEEDRVTVQWKEYGVKLNIVPEVVGGDEIRVELEPEVSTLDWANGIRINGAMLPALSTRRAGSTLRIHSGDTIVLGGLLKNEESLQVEKVPLLGDLPIIGRLFRSESFEKGRSELLIFVTPYILRDGKGPRAAEVIAPAELPEVPEWPDPTDGVTGGDESEAGETDA